MSSRGKKKTTMAKLNREARLRERRVEKQMRKDRRHAEATASDDELAPAGELLDEGDGEGDDVAAEPQLQTVPTPSEAS